MTQIQLCTFALGPHLRTSAVVVDKMLLLDLYACVYQASLPFGLLASTESTRPLLLHNFWARCCSRHFPPTMVLRLQATQSSVTACRRPSPNPKQATGRPLKRTPLCWRSASTHGLRSGHCSTELCGLTPWPCLLCAELF